MAVKLRLKRMGRTHHAVFRLCAMDARCPRDGRVLEELGQYAPANTDQGAQVNFNAERVQYWQSVGAVPTETVAALLKKHDLLKPAVVKRKKKTKQASQSGTTA